MFSLLSPEHSRWEGGCVTRLARSTAPLDCDGPMRSFSIDLNGHRYSGTWKPAGSDKVEVRSDFGSTMARLGGQDPPVIARQALRALVTQARMRA